MFCKIPPKIEILPMCPIYEKVVSTTNELDEQGNLIVRESVKLVEITSKEAVKSMPSVEEYKLKNLLDAGVPLEQIPTALLNPTDNATLDTKSSEFANKFIETYKKIE